MSPPRRKQTYLTTSYPGVIADSGHPTLWSRWDELHNHYHHHYNDTHHNDHDINSTNSQASASTNAHLPRRLLSVGYTMGFQISDCTNLSAVSEVLNLLVWSAAATFLSSSAGMGMGMGTESGGGGLEVIGMIGGESCSLAFCAFLHRRLLLR